MNIDNIRMNIMVVAEALDYFRVIPRIILVGYGALVYYSWEWYMELTTPTGEQTSFIVAVVGVAGAIIALYQKSGKDWNVDFKFWNRKE